MNKPTARDLAYMKATAEKLEKEQAEINEQYITVHRLKKSSDSDLRAVVNALDQKDTDRILIALRDTGHRLDHAEERAAKPRPTECTRPHNDVSGPACHTHTPGQWCHLPHGGKS